ncbi:hypothetical protein TraAM80_09179 [Trypanosoma rangeli]|uniref:Uncharacterized protein n=1 Tax=Trypanosoma rangeli TaxID=5698 RepID=A0A3R7JYZ4_TRYRA|nr:uncharacterized protein TraAM80_09179 [Trypanosoma rangeli]RNE97695.1 hypothetical protein TraAM80_09179 [Trypanosoma rangeli]|eukprot:RNE97695.1 hypothetical protein TraAM80_09179 [Trypanosoma rangeli]
MRISVPIQPPALGPQKSKVIIIKTAAEEGMLKEAVDLPPAPPCVALKVVCSLTLRWPLCRILVWHHTAPRSISPQLPPNLAVGSPPPPLRPPHVHCASTARA